jgi:hypothetical protein
LISNADIEKDLEELPDKVADALLVWRKTTIERETVEAILFRDFKKKQMGLGLPAGDDYIKNLVRAEESRRVACEADAAAESIHCRLYERLMVRKKQSGIRTAY